MQIELTIDGTKYIMNRFSDAVEDNSTPMLTMRGGIFIGFAIPNKKPIPSMSEHLAIVRKQVKQMVYKKNDVSQVMDWGLFEIEMRRNNGWPQIPNGYKSNENEKL